MSKGIKKVKDFLEQESIKRNCRSAYVQIQELFNEYREYLPEVRKINRNGYTHYKTQEIEEKIIELINEDDRVLLIQNDNGENIGMKACYHGLKNVILRALENEEAGAQQDKLGSHLGHYCLRCEMEDLVIRALDNHKIATQQDEEGYNLGMLCAIKGMENAVIKALDNHEASTQVTLDKINLGMYAAFYKMEKATLKALDNPDAVKQVSVFNNTMIDYIYENNLTESIEKWESMNSDNESKNDVAEIVE